ncbi:Alpha/Beta hydrolase protein [Thelonectria olida]|uniref:Alpha/Beta hydrolase protein n=1 Tax=Thelonectria olida TaxID=1576542 RepID=A0A9P8VV24_9HYPO|nr:Alpha/Beta hydrolase protein [Thelonectria olida]
MRIDKLAPGDGRFQPFAIRVRGKIYRGIRCEPEELPVATMFLIHGFPDLGFGWRYQVPYFVSLGFRVVVPDMLGFGATDAPEDLEHYTFKNIASDIKDLASNIVGDGQVILGGHDWGGAVAWRTALWYPDLVLGVFSIGTPYIPPSPTFSSLEDVVKSERLANFSYQLQFKGVAVEEEIQDGNKVRQFLNALYGGMGSRGETGFNTKDGVLFENLAVLNRSRLLTENELDYYAEKYLLRGNKVMKGPLNWYRTRELNYNDELALLRTQHKFQMPALFLEVTRDEALPPAISIGMEKYFENLTRGQVEASHWALWEAPTEVNKQVGEWTVEALRGKLSFSG